MRSPQKMKLRFRLYELSTYLLIGKTISWNTCFVKVRARTVGVVVNFMNAGFGGNIQPRKNKKMGWFPKGIIDSRTQKMALSCLITVIQNLEIPFENYLGKTKTFFAAIFMIYFWKLAFSLRSLIKFIRRFKFKSHFFCLVST